MGNTAKVFMSGGSQAVRIPAEFRVEGRELRIRKEGEMLILEPLQVDEWAWLDTLPVAEESYLKAIKARPRPAAQGRASMKGAFK